MVPDPFEPVPTVVHIVGASAVVPVPYSILRKIGAVACNVSLKRQISYPAAVLVPGRVTVVQLIWPVSEVCVRPTAASAAASAEPHARNVASLECSRTVL